MYSAWLLVYDGNCISENQLIDLANEKLAGVSTVKLTRTVFIVTYYYCSLKNIVHTILLNYTSGQRGILT
jgi:hypothetical protein